MISLFVNNKYLSTKGYLTLDNPTITLNIESKSLKEPSILKCPYTYQFKVPMTSTNAKLLGLPHSVQTVNHVRIKSVLKVDEPELVYNGYLIVNECKEDFYSISFYGSLGSVIRLLKNDGVKDTTLADIAPESIKSDFIILEPKELLQTPGRIAFHASKVLLFDVVMGRYGWGDQTKNLVSSYHDGRYDRVTEYKTDLTNLSNVGTNKDQIQPWWKVESISGEFVPFQFGDFRVEYLQPVLGFDLIFKWIQSFFSSKGYSFDYSEANAIISSYGVATPLFKSVFKSDERVSYRVKGTYQTFKCEGAGIVNFYYEPQYYLEENNYESQIGFIITGSDDTKIISCKDLDSNIRSKYPGYTYIAPLKTTATYLPYLDFLISLAVRKDVTYTVKQFIQQKHNDVPEFFLERELNGYAMKLELYSPDHYSLIPYDVEDNVGYYKNGAIVKGKSIPMLPGSSGSSIPVDQYLAKCESPYYYLTEFCKLFQFHLVERNNNVYLTKDYGSNPVSLINPWFTNVEITSVAPQVYTEGKLTFRLDSCKDWFSEQYNEIYQDTKLGSGVMTIDKYANDNSDTKSYLESKFKYNPSSNSVIQLLSPTSTGKNIDCSNILYNSSGEQVDIAGTILCRRMQSLDTSYGISYDSTEDPCVISVEYYNTLNRYRVGIPNGEYQVFDTINEDGNDNVALGTANYYPRTTLPKVNIKNSPAASVNDLSRYLSNTPYFSENAIVGPELILGIDTYYAKKITIKASLTGYPSIFKAVRVGDWIVNPTKVSVSIGKKDLPCTIEGLVYTTDVIK